VISARLLFAFRRAAAIEHRLLDLERFVEQNRVPEHHANYEWAMSSWQSRLEKLVGNNAKLKPYGEVCVLYFRRILEGGAR
jgi:hypothetical protein